MPTEDRSSEGSFVTLDVPADHVPFLRRLFEGSRADVLADLAEHEAELRDPERSRREAEVYGRLLTALDGAPLLVDDDLCRLLGEVATSTDEGNEYARVVFEHEAIFGVLAQADAALAGAGAPEVPPEGGLTVTFTAHEAGEVRWALVQRVAHNCDAALSGLRDWLADPAPASLMPITDAVPDIEEAVTLIRVIDQKLGAEKPA